MAELKIVMVNVTRDTFQCILKVSCRIKVGAGETILERSRHRDWQRRLHMESKREMIERLTVSATLSLEMHEEDLNSAKRSSDLKAL